MYFVTAYIIGYGTAQLCAKLRYNAEVTLRMYTAHTTVASLTAASLVLASCTHSLPDDWPIQQLTLPSDAKITQRPFVDHYDRPDATRTIVGKWRVSFDSDVSWTGLTGLVESQLASLGYFALDVSDAQGKDMSGEFRNYYSPDGLIEVFVSNNAISEWGAVSKESGDDSDFNYCVATFLYPRERVRQAMEEGLFVGGRRDYTYVYRQLE